MYFPAVAFRRDVVSRHGFRAGYDLVQDLDLYARVLLDGGRAVYLDTECFEYRRHPESLSSQHVTTGERFAEERRLYCEVGEAAAEAGWWRTSLAARVHPMSRLHAIAALPDALRARDGVRVRRIVRHALGPSRGTEAPRPPARPH
jgi:hypothetical protein